MRLYHQDPKKHQTVANFRLSQIRKRIREYKAERFCVRCGFNHPAALEFHHLDPLQKSFSIGQFDGRSWETILEEIAKCELICSNCHRIEHDTGA